MALWGQGESFCDNCMDLRRDVNWAMTHTGNQIINDYQTSRISEDILIEVIQIDDEEMEAAYYIRHREHDEGGFIMIKFSDRNELFGSPYPWGDLEQIPREIWTGFRNSTDKVDYYQRLLFGSPLFSYVVLMLRQYGCPN